MAAVERARTPLASPAPPPVPVPVALGGGAGAPRRTPADGELVRRARAGDGAAFRALHERYAPLVHGVAIARVAPADADDLVQEVFLAAWSDLGRLRRGERVGAWLAGMARNLARRRAEARARSPRRLPQPASEELPDARADASRDGEILAHLGALPDPYRETLALRLVEGLGGEEIARLCGLTPGSVRVNLTRGLKLLRERLQREGWR